MAARCKRWRTTVVLAAQGTTVAPLEEVDRNRRPGRRSVERSLIREMSRLMIGELP